LFAISRAIPVDSSQALEQADRGEAGADAEDTQESL
jgi:hypothetical protein